MTASDRRKNRHPLSEPVIQYWEFVGWQQDILNSARGEQLQAYWERQLSSPLPALELAADRPRPILPSYRGDVILDELTPEQQQRLAALGRDDAEGFYLVLLAAFFTLLRRISGQEDIALAIPMNASWWAVEEFGNYVGPLANLVPCRVDLSGNPSFREAIARTQRVLDEARTYRDYPHALLSEIAGESGPGKPLTCPVSFSWQSLSLEDEDEDGLLPVEHYPLGEQRGGKFDIQLTAFRAGDRLQLCWKYSTDLFDRDTIGRWTGYYQNLLSSLLDDPDRPIGTISLLSESERQKLQELGRLNRVDYPRDRCAHQLFSERAAQVPEKAAVFDRGEILTYADLDRRSDLLARYLQSLGVGPDVLVGLCVERSLAAIVGMLGILKAGGAYVPLDPAYPQERLEYMAADAQIAVLLTQTDKKGIISVGDIPIVCLDSDWEAIATTAESLTLVDRSDPHNLAYVIYTSGSTGKPKGVAIEQRTLVNFALMAVRTYGFLPSDRILQFASLSFDPAVEEIYPGLLLGSTIVLRTEEMISSIATFLERCREWELNVLGLPTAFWHLLVSEVAADPALKLPSSLRIVIIGGEKANPQKVELWQHGVGGRVQLINGYGPTEATVVATVYKIPILNEVEDEPPALPDSSAPILPEVSIGKAIGNVEIYILDSDRQLVPIGVPGELYIGGDCLARGYLHRPELNAQRFVPNPFPTPAEDKRLYRTGDLVRYLPDGSVQYLGRIDHQVKIRGFRVELGEIESAIVNYGGVKEALVIARLDRLGNQRLVAYVVASLMRERQVYKTSATLEFGAERREVETVDISRRGLGVRGVPIGLPAGESVQIYLSLPGEERLECLPGIVAWSQDKRAGISLQLNAGQSERLRHSLESYRRPERLPYQADCRLEFEGEQHEVRVTDLSTSGLGISNAPPQLGLGATLRASLCLPGESERRTFLGTVVWRQEEQAGLALRLTDEQRAAVIQGIDYLQQTSGWRQELQRKLASNLRSNLQQQLPAYMVPSNFIVLDAFPLTPNRKIDRAVLPAPDLQRDPASIVPPQTQLEEQLLALWQALLGTDNFGVNDSFFELGGNSLLAIKLVNRMATELAIEIAVPLVVAHPTIAALARAIESQGRETTSFEGLKTTIDLQAEVVLDPEIQMRQPAATVTAAAAEAILLTGATGFVGAYLLFELLQQTPARIYCLVRERDRDRARERLEKHLKSYSLWQRPFAERIVPVLGDLGQPRLGINPQEYLDLARHLDAIYHNGAWVNFVYPYESLKPANVLGTQEALRLASESRLKPLHYVSTLSVFPELYANFGPLLETDDPGYEEHLYKGYEQSKWVAERIVKLAQQQGFPVTIHRLGTLMGDSKTGITHKPKDFFCSLLKGCVQLGLAPRLDQTVVNITPVDFVGQSVVYASSQDASLGQTFHIVNPYPLPWSEVPEGIRQAGYPIETVPHDDWLEALKRAVADGRENALTMFLPLLGTEDDLPLDTMQYDCRHLMAALESSAIACPPVDFRLIHTYLAYFQRCGFIDPVESER